MSIAIITPTIKAATALTFNDYSSPKIVGLEDQEFLSRQSYRLRD